MSSSLVVVLVVMLERTTVVVGRVLRNRCYFVHLRFLYFEYLNKNAMFGVVAFFGM